MAIRIVLIYVALILVAAAAASAAYLHGVAQSFEESSPTIEHAFPEESLRPSTAPAAAGATNILMLGSDSRSEDLHSAARGQASNQRSDSIMLVHIPANRQKIYVMSVMRDTWLDIPGHGTAKVNSALALGGFPLAVQTFEQTFGARIDHILAVDFEGFRAMTDALGGVEVTNPRPFSTRYYSFPAGRQTLDGKKALSFVRERKAFAEGDYERARNQQLVLTALLSRFLTADTLANPARVSDIVTRVAPYVATDAGLTAATVGTLAVELRGVRAADVVTFSLPTLGTGWSAGGQSIVLADTEAISAIGTALQNDSLGNYVTSLS